MKTMIILILLVLPVALALTETGTYNQAKAALDKLGNSDFAQQCRNLVADEYAQCAAHQNWELEIQATMINHNTRQNELVDMLIRGDNDCPYTGAVGDTIPLKIKGESLDKQGNQIEIVCSVYCYSWNCPVEGKINLNDEANVIATVNQGIDALPSSLTSLLKDQTVLLLIDEKPYGAVFVGTHLSQFREGTPEGATLRLVSSTSTLNTISTAADPLAALVLAINNKEIVFIGATLGNKILASLGEAAARWSARQLASQFTPPADESQVVVINDQPGTLLRNNLGQRVVNFPEEAQGEAEEAVVISNYGETVGYTTTAAQQFIASWPGRYSSSAGIYVQPAAYYYNPAAASSFPSNSFQPSWNTFSGGSNVVIVGVVGGGGGFRAS